MRPIRSFAVVPSLPPRLARLRELAFNLRWSWDYETVDLFRRLDRDLWESTGHNPVLLLGAVKQEQLADAAADDGFLAHYQRVCDSFDAYVRSERTWFKRARTGLDRLQIAYFSAEFGLTECLRTYSGGLGILAGDHLKSASDLGLPVVGVGLLYQEGYFRQYLNADGWQGELYPRNDFANLPVSVERDDERTPLVVAVEFPDTVVKAQVWRVQVGRVPLYLLDTNLPANRPRERDITDRLYGGDQETRIQQEIVLGIGGVRALAALGVRPTVCHMNEGHSAFLGLERIRALMAEHGVSFAEAREACAAGNLFTTHTPVPAGIDVFAPDLVERYFGAYYPQLGLSRDEFLALGRRDANDGNEPFSMAILALHLAAQANGVSELHRDTSRALWQGVWPGLQPHEVPIAAVTNGVHAASWVAAPELTGLYERYLGPAWLEDPSDESVWEAVAGIPAEELWRIHERRREQLVAFARRRLQSQLERRGAPDSEVAVAEEVLDPSALTIGFGRRVAGYKRGTLLFRDPERLARILNRRDRPVQIIIAGKAHPQDNLGKDIVRQILHFCRQPEFRTRVVFLEDYDMVVARQMLQGCDVWLNTPRRPQEASGTSGMKAALNGGLNMSVLDGWWPEAYRTGVGWRIGQGELYDDPDYQDEVESNAIYELLEKEVIPLFYERGADGTPRGWTAFMKSSLRTIGPRFNTNRMVHEYFRQFYLPAARRSERLSADGLAGARELAAWLERLRAHWSQLRFGRIVAGVDAEVKVGSSVKVRASLYLGELRPEDLLVQIYHGPLDHHFEIAVGQALPMVPAGDDGKGYHAFAGEVPCNTTGRYGFTVRVLPQHESLANPFAVGLIQWADVPVPAEAEGLESFPQQL